MALKIGRGISHLIGTRERLRATVLIVLVIVAIAILASKGDNIPAGTKSDKSSVSAEAREESEVVTPIQADHILLSASESSAKKTAKIVTCPRCRLNALPRVKEFVHEHAKVFEPNLKIDFIFGEDPVLHLYEDEKEVEKINLESYDSKKIIQKLVHFGMKPSTETDIVREALGKQ